jgi:hypothetical protein
MEPHTLFKFADALGFFVSGAVIIAFLLYEWGRIGAKRFEEYDKKYCYINLLIHARNVCKPNHEFIKSQLIELQNMKYKDDEKTEVLIREFQAKLEEVDEFSVESIFAGE